MEAPTRGNSGDRALFGGCVLASSVNVLAAPTVVTLRISLRYAATVRLAHAKRAKFVRGGANLRRRPP